MGGSGDLFGDVVGCYGEEDSEVLGGPEGVVDDAEAEVEGDGGVGDFDFVREEERPGGDVDGLGWVLERKEEGVVGYEGEKRCG